MPSSASLASDTPSRGRFARAGAGNTSKVSEQRFDQLERKRDTEGLTGDEANELGRLMAEREGKPYSNAEMRDEPEETEGVDEVAKEGEEAGQDEAVRPTGDKAEPADAERPLVGPGGSGYAPSADAGPDEEDSDTPSTSGPDETPGAVP